MLLFWAPFCFHAQMEKHPCTLSFLTNDFYLQDFCMSIDNRKTSSFTFSFANLLEICFGIAKRLNVNPCFLPDGLPHSKVCLPMKNGTQKCREQSNHQDSEARCQKSVQKMSEDSLPVGGG